jgi:hypothetical protein
MIENPSAVFLFFRMAMDAFGLAVGVRWCVLAVLLFLGS